MGYAGWGVGLGVGGWGGGGHDGVRRTIASLSSDPWLCEPWNRVNMMNTLHASAEPPTPSNCYSTYCSTWKPKTVVNTDEDPPQEPRNIQLQNHCHRTHGCLNHQIVTMMNTLHASVKPPTLSKECARDCLITNTTVTNKDQNT